MARDLSGERIEKILLHNICNEIWVNLYSLDLILTLLGLDLLGCTALETLVRSTHSAVLTKVRWAIIRSNPTNLSSAMLRKLFDGKYGVSNQKTLKSLQNFLINLVKIFKYICTGIFWDSLRGEEGCILFEGNWRSLQCSMFSTLDTVYSLGQ